MTEIAALVLAHADPPQVRRLVTALEDVPIFLHCDAKTNGSVASEMLSGLPRRVTVMDRTPTSLASWSLVDTELRLLREAVDKTKAEHIILSSGADYPLVSVNELSEQLGKWRGKSHFWNMPIPYDNWDTPRHPNGGMWRFNRRFLTFRDRVVIVRGVALRLPFMRTIPAGIELRASSQWKIYSREHAELLLDIVDKNPELLKFWKSTLIPDESFAASLLGSRVIAGSEGLESCRANAWYIDWPDEDTHHPKWLDSSDFENLRSARCAPVMTVDDAFRQPLDAHEKVPDHAKWFARKFSTNIDTQILDRVDLELRR